MKKIKIVILMCVFLLSGLYTYAEEAKKELASSVLRLHVVANSDKKEDRELKLKVRDAVTEVISDITKGSADKDEAMLLSMKNIGEIRRAAKRTVLEEGYDYPVSVEIGKTKFPTKYYENITLPRGVYDAVNVKIGSAEGKNWWCIMYPPLYGAPFYEEDSDDALCALEEALSAESFKIITEKDSSEVKIKLKILEWF